MFKTFKITATVVLTSIAGLALADQTALDGFRALSPVEVAESPITAALVPVTVSDADSAAKGVLRAGDRIAFEIGGVEGSKIYILNMDSAGVIQMIYPNRFAAGGETEQADMLTVPAEGANYEFEVGGEGGTEVVKVIAIDGESSAFDALLASLFDSEKAFPRAIQPAVKTTEALNDFFATSGDAKIRETALEYVIAK